jgi:uncharacterized glyoxalase superfamily protein PhnB
VTEAVHYYTEVLGFELDHTHGDPPEHASVKAGVTSFHFSARTEVGRPTAYVTVYVDDIEPIHRDLAERGVEISIPPMEVEWGARILEVRDHLGTPLLFAQVHDPDAHHGT